VWGVGCLPVRGIGPHHQLAVVYAAALGEVGLRGVAAPTNGVRGGAQRGGLAACEDPGAYRSMTGAIPTTIQRFHVTAISMTLGSRRGGIVCGWCSVR